MSPPGPGRPRSPEADQAIVDAALVVFAEAGYEGLTIEAVAARAGVGKATVYRRYPGKAELVFHAASCLTGGDAPFQSKMYVRIQSWVGSFLKTEYDIPLD